MTAPAEPTGARPPRRIGEAAAAGVLVVMGLVFLWRSLVEAPLGSMANPGPGAAPLLLASLLVIFAIWTAAAAALPAAKPSEASSFGPGGLLHAAFVLAAIAFAAGAIGYLGYRATVLAVLVFLFGIVERKPIAMVLLLSLALAFGSYGLFVRVLKIPLPIGVLGF